jgi:hypothetical protein
VKNFILFAVGFILLSCLFDKDKNSPGDNNIIENKQEDPFKYSIPVINTCDFITKYQFLNDSSRYNVQYDSITFLFKRGSYLEKMHGSEQYINVEYMRRRDANANSTVMADTVEAVIKGNYNFSYLVQEYPFLLENNYFLLKISAPVGGTYSSKSFEHIVNQDNLSGCFYLYSKLEHNLNHSPSGDIYINMISPEIPDGTGYIQEVYGIWIFHRD